MTPDDIRSQRFATRLVRGLSPEEVSAFLEDVAEAFENIQRANAGLASRVKMLEDQIHALSEHEAPAAPVLRDSPAPATSPVEILRAATLREIEALLHDAQAQAQTIIDSATEREATLVREGEALKAQSQREADELLAGAAARAAALVAAAHDEEAALRTEIARLSQSHVELVDSIRTTLDTYHQWLATIDPRGRARGRREAFESGADGREPVAPTLEVRVG
jgi:DivIVA domain-containing protein